MQYPFILTMFLILGQPGVGAAKDDESNPFVLEQENCKGIDVGEVGRLLAIELKSLGFEVKRSGMISINLSCVGNQVNVSVFDDLTDKELSRIVSLKRKYVPDQERILALAASNLIMTSWMELLIPMTKEKREIKKTSNTEQGANAEVEDVEFDDIKAEIKAVVWENIADFKEPPLFSYGILVGLNIRDLLQPYPIGTIAIRLLSQIEPEMDLFFEAGFEMGRTNRRTGIVTSYLGLLSVGLKKRLTSSGRFSIWAEASIGSGYTRLQASASESFKKGHYLDSLAAQVYLGLSPTLELGGLRLSLPIGGGVSVPALVGHVEDDHDARSGPVLMGIRFVLERRPDMKSREFQE